MHDHGPMPILLAHGGISLYRRSQNSIIVFIRKEGASSLRKGLFTSSVVDNIDHNPSSTTAHDSFHGTEVSLFQQPTAQVPGVCRNRVSLGQATSTGTKYKVSELP